MTNATLYLIDRFGQQTKTGFHIDPATGMAYMVTFDVTGAPIVSLFGSIVYDQISSEMVVAPNTQFLVAGRLDVRSRINNSGRMAIL
jgi:hypothetical protein